MPYTQQGLPYQGLPPIARQNSYLAAEAVAASRGRKTGWYVAYLWSRPAGRTDHQAARALHIPRSSVCSIRHTLCTALIVEGVGSVTGRYGKRCTLWALTARGRRLLPGVAVPGAAPYGGDDDD